MNTKYTFKKKERKGLVITFKNGHIRKYTQVRTVEIDHQSGTLIIESYAGKRSFNDDICVTVIPGDSYREFNMIILGKKSDLA